MFLPESCSRLGCFAHVRRKFIDKGGASNKDANEVIKQIDNNAIERQIRPIAVGRKNYLFAGSHNGAEAAAIFYSLINSCKLNKINPREYLADVIRRLPTHPNDNIA